MSRIIFSRFSIAAAAAAIVGAAVACDDGIGVAPAAFPNYVDTILLYAVEDTPIPAESGYDIAMAMIARIDKDEFDFAFNIDTSGSYVLLPAGALGLPSRSGLQIRDKEFDEIDEAPFDYYITDEAITVAVGDVLVGRSRSFSGNCYYLGALPRYGKFRVLAVDTQIRTVTLEILINSNCGYRGLEPGFPKR